MRRLLCLLLTACAATSRPRVAAPPAEPRDTAESTPALPVLQCPSGTRAVEAPLAQRQSEVFIVSGIGSCCVGGCEPRRDPVWYAATVCQRQFEGLHVVRAVACRSADGAVNGPFVVLANQARIDGACREDVFDGRWTWRLDGRSAQARVREEGAFVGGRRTGAWMIASDDGTMVSRGHFVDDERVGVWTTEIFAGGALVERRTERHDDGLRVFVEPYLER